MTERLLAIQWTAFLGLAPAFVLARLLEGALRPRARVRLWAALLFCTWLPFLVPGERVELILPGQLASPSVWSTFPLPPWLYLAGLLGMVLGGLARHLRTLEVDRAVEAAPARVTARLRAAAQRAGLDRTPALGSSTRVTSPFLLGVVRNRVVLPEGLCRSGTGIELDLTLSHECEHVRQGHPWLDLGARFLTVLFWWNPLVWWGYARLRYGMESACDQAVVRKGPHDALSYAECLLRFARARSLARSRARPRARSGLALTREGRMLEARLREILELHALPDRRSSAVLRLAPLAAVLLVLFASDAPGIKGLRVESLDLTRPEDVARLARRHDLDDLMSALPVDARAALRHSYKE